MNDTGETSPVNGEREYNRTIICFLLILIIVFSYVLIDSVTTHSALFLSEPVDVILEEIYEIDHDRMIRLSSVYGRKYLFLPLGRIDPARKSYDVFIDSDIVHPRLALDKQSGYWFNFSLSEFINDCTIKLVVTNHDSPVSPLLEQGTDLTEWLAPSKYIDSDNQVIIDLAQNLTVNCSTVSEKVARIFEHVFTAIVYREIPDKDHENASQVLELGYGVCRHKSRVFIALCRAASIPARSVDGISCYGFHTEVHQWAEYLNSSGYWKQVDPTWSETAPGFRHVLCYISEFALKYNISLP